MFHKLKFNSLNKRAKTNSKNDVISKTLKFSIPFLISLFILNLTFGQVQDKKKPNILWITCEDMSADLPDYGDNTVMTPNISRLVREGVKFTNMFSVSGVCAPSRSAIITGMYPTSIGTQHMRTGTKDIPVPPYEAVPPADVKCFTEYLRAGGYYCTNNAKTDYQFGVPFTAWNESSNKAHWRNRPKDKPFFSVFNIEVTHESRIWMRKDEPLRVDPQKIQLPPYYPESPVIRKDMARYYDNIMVMDSIAGGILKQLEEDGLLENTIVVFFSDHGAGLPWYKRELYDRGLHVPFIVRYPGQKGAGTQENELHSFVDLAPSMLSLAGIEIPKHIQGKAFLGEAKEKVLRKYIYAARDRMDEQYDMVRAVRDKQYKYIRNYQPEKLNYQDLTYRKQMDLMKEILKFREDGKLNKVQQKWFMAKPKEELYDVKNDPYELKNLADDPDYKNVLNRLKASHEGWMKEIKDLGFTPEKEMLNAMWPGLKQPVTEAPVLKTSGGSKDGKVNVVISCDTKGASIAYKIEGIDKDWIIYTKPLSVSKGSEIKAKAIRYGYKPSEEEKLDL